LEAQREILKGISQETIKLFGQAPPGMELYIVHCPMVNADWLSAVAEVHNPYSSEMPTCGSITGSLKPASAKENPRFAEGYYCPLYPDHVTQTPGPCPLDNQPLKRVRLEKVLTVPESAVIDTGTRKIAYRQSAPGTFDMVEVKLGPRAGEYYPVLAGLAEGDQVATAGAFLVDAENRLNPSAAAQYFGTHALVLSQMENDWVPLRFSQPCAVPGNNATGSLDATGPLALTRHQAHGCRRRSRGTTPVFGVAFYDSRVRRS
jgi:hypothetical protein